MDNYKTGVRIIIIIFFLDIWLMIYLRIFWIKWTYV